MLDRVSKQPSMKLVSFELHQPESMDTYHDREVPRDYLATDTKGFVFGIRQLRIARLNRLPIHLVRPSCVVSKDRDSLSDIFVHGLLVRLAVVPRIDSSKDMAVLLTKVTELPQQLASFGGRNVAPC